MTKNTLMFGAATLGLLALSACADSNVVANNLTVCTRGLSGFWSGLWHGWIALFGFIGSIFDSEIAIYDVCNNGGWYDFGFALGIGAFSSSSGAAGAQSRR